MAGTDNVTGVRTLGSAIDEAFTLWERAMARRKGCLGLSTGFSALDAATGGFHPGQLTVLASRPATGRTTLAMGFALNVARTGVGVLLATRMAARDVAAHLVAAEGHVDLLPWRLALNDHEHAAAFTAAASRLDKLPLWIDERWALDLEALASDIARISTESDLGLVVTDFPLAAEDEAATRDERRADATGLRGLRELAQRAQLPVVATAGMRLAPLRTSRRHQRRPQRDPLAPTSWSPG